jgi:hypothetical protein
MISLEYEESLHYNYSEAINMKNRIESRREVQVLDIITKEGKIILYYHIILLLLLLFYHYNIIFY